MSNVRQLQPKTRGKETLTREDMERNDSAFMYAIAEVLKDERELTEKRLRELDGAHLLLGSARKVAAANLTAVTKAIAPTTQRRATIIEGVAPQWAAGVFK
ncbi:hypothetical protein [Alloyangia pacifica]|uniref:Uncharacterized protein n=1 Tax=Alloyangia pacifica TaxID=311180 RepID=A0A1I6PRM9_9RHOB|nr:hypothetical protein [Alloyangia pacifica]SDG33671.1 hypothetical protein SAMN04488245_102412 [Alloyangia pacifica]SFS42695.1 hypothetical protein SAMN04488050_101713 [Alloyangia pacifica]